MLLLEPTYPRAVKMRRSKKGSGVKLVRVWGGGGDTSDDVDWRKVPRMPNPMPDNIVSLLKLAGEATWLTVPLAPFIYLLIKSWFAGRNSRKLKMKKGDTEVEFQGAWSDRNLRSAFIHFQKMTRHLRGEEIQVIENGKVIESGKAPAYKVTEADVRRARELRTKKPPAKRARKKSTKKGAKRGGRK